jgi:diguanylate cyclase (GGDEF)-like protein/PAS domain S-box-containing protein
MAKPKTGKMTAQETSRAEQIFSTWNPGPEERYQMIQVAAYHIAEREGFKGNQSEYWALAEEHIRLMLALRESEEKLQIIIDTALDAAVLMNADGVITSWSHQAEVIFGWTRQEAIGQLLHETIVPRRNRKAHLHGMKRFLETGIGPMLNTRIELSALHRSGYEFAVELSIVPIKTVNNVEFSASIRDIAARKQMEQALRESEERWKFALEVAGDGVWDWNISANEVLFSTRMKAMLELGEGNVKGRLEDWEARIHPEDKARAIAGVWECIRGSQPRYVCEYRLLGKGGSVRWILARGMLVHRAGGGKPSRMIVTHTDITTLKEVEAREHHLAQHDVLTNLPNRALFSDRLQQALAIAKREKGHLGVLFLDLDKFKPINDTYGHGVGDLLLQEVANRMQKCVRESDTVARIGGDEFVVLLPSIETENDALVVAEKIREALNQPFEIAGKSLSISSSTGVAVYPQHGTDELRLSKNADAAMYRVKKGGRNKVQLYQPRQARTRILK